ncbi:hypothetical protein V9L05_15205 [Bernardetia sp. Wsw4-3y2]|uniref:hypothetical protein n=1 Tax=Bernardetia sp. Wsw4-3y2 TaxID=3127471 RepID=UPI0030CACD17
MDQDIKKNILSISTDTLNGKYHIKNDFARSILNYPAMMVPSVQEPIIEYLSMALNNNVSLLDPFVGASNTLVTGMKYGMNVCGQDINPLSILISQVKTSYYSIEELIDAQKRLIDTIKNDNLNSIEIDFFNIDKWFTKNSQVELSKIYRAVNKEASLKIRKFFWVVIAETIRLTSNDRTSTFKMHIRSIEEINQRFVSPIKTFIKVSHNSIESLTKYIHVINENGYLQKGKYSKNIDIIWGDTNLGINTKKTFNLLVTSPPYGDNHTTVTYGQFSYLPLQWIPSEDIDNNITIDYLRTIQEIDSKSLGGKSKINTKEIEEQIFCKSNTLKDFISQFKNEEREKTKKVSRFVYDLDKSIDNILLKMRKNSFLVWTIGNRNVNKKIVRNDLILNELFKFKKIDLFTDLEREIMSKRMPRRNNFSSMMNKEKILIYKKTQ